VPDASPKSGSFAMTEPYRLGFAQMAVRCDTDLLRELAIKVQSPVRLMQSQVVQTPISHIMSSKPRRLYQMNHAAPEVPSPAASDRYGQSASTPTAYSRCMEICVDPLAARLIYTQTATRNPAPDAVREQP
jgi:hypothetical protein